MSLSPVIGTDMLETANGDVAPISSENGPHDPTSVKCGGSRVPCPGEGSEDTDNHVEVENKVYDGKGDSEDSESGSKDTDIHEASNTEGPPGAALLWEPAQRAQRAERAHFKELPPREGPATSDRQPRETDTDSRDEEEDGEKEKQDEEEDEKNEKKWIHQRAGGRTRVEVWVRNVRGMQDSKSLDEISQSCGGGLGGRGGQSEGRRATISSALELEGTVHQEGDLTHFICKNLEQKIKMSSKPSLDCSDSDCSGPIYRSRGSSRRPADIPPIDPAVLLDLERHTQEVSHSVEMMMRSLNGTIQNMTALSVGYIQTYRDSVDSLGESVDMSIKIRDIKRTLDALEAICK
ncbi:BLOC-1-related complex subunit 6 [Dissostichus eleginoides]|uniref:BLOC-1-related complex subunit 6 n=1 Tax=Dissostichus eleginoides TaxID=100907 RepID=A0AAD9FH24_DISEL|nr:BLOC-1-related complex subunit 6 [Dissostichus eleginoides]